MLKIIRKKVDELKAIQFDGTYNCFCYMKTVFGDFYSSYSANESKNEVYNLRVRCENNDIYYVNIGDYVVFHKRNFHVISQTEFNKSYEVLNTKH